MSTKKVSKKQEVRLAKTLGGKRQSNSGATPFQKGDVVTELFAIEAKTSTSPKQSISIRKEWMDKIRREAFAMGKPYSAVAFDFGTGSLGNRETFYIIDEQLFIKLHEKLEEEENA
jgi:hypothetical protein